MDLTGFLLKAGQDNQVTRGIVEDEEFDQISKMGGSF